MDLCSPYRSQSDPRYQHSHTCLLATLPATACSHYPFPSACSCLPACHTLLQPACHTHCYSLLATLLATAFLLHSLLQPACHPPALLLQPAPTTILSMPTPACLPHPYLPQHPLMLSTPLPTCLPQHPLRLDPFFRLAVPRCAP